MVLNKSIWGPEPRVATIKGTDLKSLKSLIFRVFPFLEAHGDLTKERLPILVPLQSFVMITITHSPYFPTDHQQV